MTWVQVEPRSCDQGRRRNDAFALFATLRQNMAFCYSGSFFRLAQCGLNGRNGAVVQQRAMVGFKRESETAQTEWLVWLDAIMAGCGKQELATNW